MNQSGKRIIELGSEEDAFSRGGNRLCFVHPDDAARCIKVPRADRLPAIKRREKHFPKNLKPLASFDDNAQELAVYLRILKHIGEPAFELIPRCYGCVETNFGPGLCSDMIRNDDGQISITLKQYLWQNGKTGQIMSCVARFARQWREFGMPSRDLLLHNIVVQCREGSPDKLFLIDGLGWGDLLPLAYHLPWLARRKAGKKVVKLEAAIDALIFKKENNLDYGYHGWMPEEKRQ